MSIAKQFHVGQSVEGREIEGFIVGDGADTVVVIGGVHGDERVTTPLVERMFAEFSSSTHPDQTVVYIPCANPDGWHAKSRLNANKVDINRNFGTDWRPDFSDPDYNPGSAPNSEPETRAIEGLLQGYKPQRVLAVHQPLECNDYDGPGAHALALIMSKHNGLPVKKLEGPYHGSLGTYCAEIQIPIVTLELAKEITVEDAWSQQAVALLDFIRIGG